MFVLLVEDDEAQRWLLQRALARAGHDVEALGSAFGVCNRVAGRGGAVPDVVVLDLALPGLSGAAVLELLARDARTRNVPVLLHSAQDLTSLTAAAKAHPRCRAWQKDGRVAVFVHQVEQLHAEWNRPRDLVPVVGSPRLQGHG